MNTVFNTHKIHVINYDGPLKQANGLACTGKYEAGSIPSFAGNASLFVKQHAY